MRAAVYWKSAVLAVCAALGGCTTFTPRTVRMGNSDATVPMGMVREFFTVPVMINGKGPFTFLIDTGNPWVIVSSQVAGAAGLPRANVRAVDVFSDGRRVEWPHGIVHIESLKLADVDFRDSYARVAGGRDGILGPADAPANARFDGVLGMAVLGKVPVTLDMPNKTLRLWRRSPLENVSFEDPAVQRVRGEHWVPEIALTIAKGLPAERRVDVVLDTGCFLPLVLPKAAAAAFDAAETVEEVGTRTAYGTPVVRVERHHTPIEFPGVVLTNNPVVFYDGGPNYAMGLPLLRHYRITLDFSRNALRMDLTDPPPAGPNVIPKTGPMP